MMRYGYFHNALSLKKEKNDKEINVNVIHFTKFRKKHIKIRKRKYTI